MSGLLLAAGLAGLWFGTELTIRGATTIAARLGLSEFIVGVAILSIGSDLPEIAVAVDAAIRNLAGGEASDVVVGSALGSSMAQIGFVLGVLGLLGRPKLSKSIVYRHGSVLLGSLIVLGMIGIDGAVTRAEGVALITLYMIYFVSLITETNSNGNGSDGATPDAVLKSWLFLVTGLVIVIGAAEITVSSVIHIARSLNIEESLIAVTAIGVGTSLPELSISLAAILKGRTNLSVGNIIGSNIFDTLMPIGVAAAISSLTFNPALLTFDLPYLLVLSAAVLFFFWRGRGVRKRESIFILAIYGGYAFVTFAAMAI